MYRQRDRQIYWQSAPLCNISKGSQGKYEKIYKNWRQHDSLEPQNDLKKVWRTEGNEKHKMGKDKKKKSEIINFYNWTKHSLRKLQNNAEKNVVNLPNFFILIKQNTTTFLMMAFGHYKPKELKSQVLESLHLFLLTLSHKALSLRKCKEGRASKKKA